MGLKNSIEYFDRIIEDFGSEITLSVPDIGETSVSLPDIGWRGPDRVNLNNNSYALNRDIVCDFG